MPCYTINTVSVKVNAKFRDILEQAIKKVGYEYNVDIIEGSNKELLIEISGSLSYNAVEVRNTIQRKYSEIALKKVAMKRRWILNQNKKQENKFQLRRY